MKYRMYGGYVQESLLQPEYPNNDALPEPLWKAMDALPPITWTFQSMGHWDCFQYESQHDELLRLSGLTVGEMVKVWPFFGRFVCGEKLHIVSYNDSLVGSCSSCFLESEEI